MQPPTPPTLCSATLQQRLAMAYPELMPQQQQQQQQDVRKINNLTHTGRSAAVAVSTPLTLQAPNTKATTTALTARSSKMSRGEYQALSLSLEDNNAEQDVEDATIFERHADNDDEDDNQMKRNDVHYLLKQLNSFSDIEEIEIVDMKQRQQRHRDSDTKTIKRTMKAATVAATAAAAAAVAVAVAAPQQPPPHHAHAHGHGHSHVHAHSHSPTTSSLVLLAGGGSPTSTHSHKGGGGCLRRYASLHQQQQHQHLQQQLLHATDSSAASSARLQFDDYIFESCHYLETNYFAATYRTAMVESCSHEFRPSTTTPTTTTTRSDTFELHEVEPPSVICKAGAPGPIPTPTPTHRIKSPPPQYFQMQTRMTSSGVQTELTAESLAQLSHSQSSSSSSGGGATRAPPFFRCCYTPIDRWRERRLVAKKQQRSEAPTSSSTQNPQPPQHQQQPQQPHKNGGHAV
ncbi:lateral signaling target protein 2 homolog [Scaptodrosophila lebanonensis]|uniref:Lateral signaling target protein 2 homolog n=1 Tax=Drosophila lebanonensis TaxID=7225 RepID=A0A6J2U6U3_DROLE|nr:lateral signaling target protein 2 homolog [Scaptodrosophila lebanonensis]